MEYTGQNQDRQEETHHPTQNRKHLGRPWSGGSLPTSTTCDSNQLHLALQDEWEDTLQETTDNLVMSMR